MILFVLYWLYTTLWQLKKLSIVVNIFTKVIGAVTFIPFFMGLPDELLSCERPDSMASTDYICLSGEAFIVLGFYLFLARSIFIVSNAMRCLR